MRCFFKHVVMIAKTCKALQRYKLGMEKSFFSFSCNQRFSKRPSKNPETTRNLEGSSSFLARTVRQWARSDPHRFSVPLPFWCLSSTCGASLGITVLWKLWAWNFQLRSKSEKISPWFLLGWFPVYWEIRNIYIYTYVYMYEYVCISSKASDMIYKSGNHRTTRDSQIPLQGREAPTSVRYEI